MKKGEPRLPLCLGAAALPERVPEADRVETAHGSRLVPALVVVVAVGQDQVRIERRLAIEDVLDGEIDVQVLERSELPEHVERRERRQAAVVVRLAAEREDAAVERARAVPVPEQAVG